jgi:poly-gamma-glutamate capsule biosynthesis protein CapA/YwtB (metallophosphatase superfamily)
MKKICIIFFSISVYVNLSAQDTTRLSLIFFGDIMQHDSQISAAYEPAAKKYSYTDCFQFIKPYLQTADLAIGNLEVTLAGKPYKGYPQFSAPDELVTTLKDVGMDVLVTANNHCVDRGKQGLERTIAVLDSFEILHTGTFVDEASRLNDYPLILDRKGVRLAILNYTFSTNGLPVTKPNIVNRIDTTVIRKDIFKAKKSHPDIIIVFTHWGIEYQSLPSFEQQAVSEFCFKQGADLVIGAHPHVIQPMEWRKEKNQLVAYSLGNFVSGQRKRYTDGGALLSVELEKIFYTPDSTTTQIDSAGFVLEWIYKTTDMNKDYYILPVPTFQKDSTGFIKDQESKDAFKTYVEDSRALLNKHNVNIQEITIQPEIFTLEFANVTFNDAMLAKLKNFGMIKMFTNENKIRIGEFISYKDAADALQKITNEVNIQNGIIVKER